MKQILQSPKQMRKVLFGSDEKLKRGPKPERVHIPDKDWEEAVKDALQKKRPPEGWPDRGKGQKIDSEE